MTDKNNSQTLVNLASPKMGTKILSVSDEFFGEAIRMLSDKEPVFIEDKFDEHGKWMDGWESKRRRDGGNDWVIIKLGSPGVISTIEVDTSYFTGNFPPFFSLEGCYSSEIPNDDDDWILLKTKTSLIGDKKNNFDIKSTKTVNYIRLQIFPDGGVARLRLYGSIAKSKKFKNKKINLASLLDGASVIACNNEHFGKAENILAPGKAKKFLHTLNLIFFLMVDICPRRV